jgi:hypothetical protein
MDRVLALTSPHMTDTDGSTDIADAQHLLAHNRFDDFAPYGDSSQAGEFGETTAGACHRAKFWLGWPAGESTGTFGRNLRDYLSGARNLPPAYKARRLMRLRRQRLAKRARIMALARAQLGIKEAPAGSNRVKFSLWYGLVGSWCAMFVTWVLAAAGGIPGPLRGARWAYVPYMENAAAEHRYGMSFVPSSAVMESDAVTYDWDHDGTADHVGVFSHWIVPGRTFEAIEGNTSVSSDSNGGEVMRRTRELSQVRRFIRFDI